MASGWMFEALMSSVWLDIWSSPAKVAELADALDLGSSPARGGSSSLPSRIRSGNSVQINADKRHGLISLGLLCR